MSEDELPRIIKEFDGLAPLTQELVKALIKHNYMKWPRTQPLGKI